MKKLIILFIAIFSLFGCSQDANENKTISTKYAVYNSKWDGNPIIVKQRNNNGDFEKTKEITDLIEVQKLIEALGNAEWEENVKVDIRPPDYSFTWNSYKHNVWVIEEFKRLELIIEGQSNYGTLSEELSEFVFEMLTGQKINS